MKQKILYIFLLISVISYSQRFKEVLKWQVETRSGGLVFGISETKLDAELIINDFQRRNANSKYDISFHKPYYKYVTISVKNTNETPVDKFKFLAKKPYKVISFEDIKSIDIAKEQGLIIASEYYSKTKHVNNIAAISRINYLINNFDIYRIKNTN